MDFYGYTPTQTDSAFNIEKKNKMIHQEYALKNDKDDDNRLRFH
mgnify:CR=1 FL=1